MIQQLIENKCIWAKGSLHQSDMEFIFKTVCDSRAQVLVEIGIASGVSSAVILGAMAQSRAEGAVHDNILHSFDILEHCFFDRKIPVGSAVKEMLPDEAGRQQIHIPANALNVKDFCGEQSVDFCFIDACHRHPWPVLDLLAILPLMKPDGVVCLHDINLPLIQSSHQVFGVKYVFDSVTCRKSNCRRAVPNCGALHFDDDLDDVANQLVELLTLKDWETNVDTNHLIALGLDVGYLANHSSHTEIT